MKLIRIKARMAEFSPGHILHLTEEQASPRIMNLEDLGEGRYHVERRVEFREGEIIGFEGDITPAIHELVELGDVPLEGMDPLQLMARARGLGLSPHPNTGKPKLIDLIRARETDLDRQRLEDEAAAVKATRLAELEERIETLSDEEKAEMAALKGQGA